MVERLKRSEQAFRSYSRLSLSDTITSDIGVLGVYTFVTVGMLKSFFSTELRSLLKEAFFGYCERVGLAWRSYRILGYPFMHTLHFSERAHNG